MKVETVAATTRMFDCYDHIFQFSLDELKRFASKSIGKKVTDTFFDKKVIGVVTNAKVIDSDYDFKINKRALCVGFIEEPIELIEYAIAKIPLDASVPFIKINQ